MEHTQKEHGKRKGWWLAVIAGVAMGTLLLLWDFEWGRQVDVEASAAAGTSVDGRTARQASRLRARIPSGPETKRSQVLVEDSARESQRITGFVRHAATGWGVPGVGVSITSPDGKKSIVGSGRSGEFTEILYAPVSRIELEVDLPWTLVGPSTLEVRDGHAIDLRVEGPYCLLGGRVQLVDGSPVRGVTLRVTGSEYRCRSIEGGRFGIQLPNLREAAGKNVTLEIAEERGGKRYRLVEPHRTWPPHSLRAIVTVVPVPRRPLRFRVLRPDGARIDGLQYRISVQQRGRTGRASMGPSSACRISKDGQVQLTAYDGDTGRIQFYCKGSWSGQSKILDYSVPQGLHTVRLEQTRMQRVEVVDSQCAPVLRATVEALTELPALRPDVDGTAAYSPEDWGALIRARDPDWRIRIGKRTTDVQGMAVLDCGTRTTCVLRVGATSFGTRIKKIRIDPNEVHRIVLQKGATLKGIVIDADSLAEVARSYGVRKLRMALVGLRGQLYPSRGAEIRKDRFEFRGVTPGMASLWLCAWSGARGVGSCKTIGPKLLDLRVQAIDNPELRVEVGPGLAGSVAGTLESSPLERGESLRVGWWRAGDTGPARPGSLVRIAANHRFHLSGLPPGTVRWQAGLQDSSYRSSILLPTITRIHPGQTTSVSLRLHSRRVRYEVAPALQRAMGAWGLMLQTKDRLQVIRIMHPGGATARVGLGRYRLYLFGFPPKTLGSYEITSTTTKVRLIR